MKPKPAFRPYPIHLFIAALMLFIILVALIVVSPNSPTTADDNRPAGADSATPAATAAAIILLPHVGGPLAARDPAPEEHPPANELPIGEVRILGPEEIVFQWSRDACEPLDIPDVPARAFLDAQGQVQLLSSHYVTRRKIGPDLHNLVHECAPVMVSDYNADPSLFSDRGWIAATYTLDGVTVYALIHNEHQGHTHPHQCPSGQYRDCWYNSITLAISTDGGRSYAHVAPPPRHLVASLPYPYAPGAGPMGYFGPSNILHNPRDGYFYVLFRAEAYGEQEWGVCIMRTQDLADPTSWRAWDGAGFNTRFIDPYRPPAGEDWEPARAVCHPIARPEIGRMSRNVTYNTYYDRFMLLGAVGEIDPVTGEARAGIYFSLSDDLIHWTPRQLILPVELPWTFTCGDADPIEYPALLDPAPDGGPPARNFDVTGQRVYLYFKRFNYEDCRGTLNYDLIRIPIEFN